MAGRGETRYPEIRKLYARPAESHGPPARKGKSKTIEGPGEGLTMDAQAIIIMLIVGAIAGWLAGQIVSGGGFGLIGDIIIGIIGAVVGGWLFPRFFPAFGGPLVASIINATIGAIIVLVVVRLVARR